ncbi:MAG: amino acid permease [Verrucomicrobia bacterium]|nr:amino acid permease [Verrucomicrobiota bacterium]
MRFGQRLGRFGALRAQKFVVGGPGLLKQKHPAVNSSTGSGAARPPGPNPPAGSAAAREHPRTVGWFGTTAVAMGGINQSLFLLSALFVGQGDIPGQGSAAVPLLIAGLLLSWAATPGWTELILMYPKRVGGIAATCSEAFRPYSPVLANLTGVCYWWGWVPTCGVTALLAASAIQQWYLPWFSVPLLASGLVLLFTFVNLCGVKWVMRMAVPIATASAGLAFLSALIPVFSGTVNWQQAFTFHLTVPFEGWFGQVTSVMAGLYLIGFAAPAFEQAACHVGETINPSKNVPRAMFTSALMASLYFIVLPLVWLGTLGPEPLGKELALELGPTFAPLLGGAAKAAAIWFMVLNMLHGTIAPLAGASRTLAQLAEDGLLPEFMAKRSRTDVPWVATLLTAGMAIAFLLIGDPVWLIAAANLTYLIGIAMPNVAVWLLRRDQPDMPRPYRAPRGTIGLGLFAAGAWALSTILGFEQYGLPTVLAGIAFAYAGAALYAWRKMADRRKAGLPAIGRSLHVKLTGAMLLVLGFDAAGYLIAVGHVGTEHTALIVALEDIFVAVALLTISVGLVLPGMIAHSAVEVSQAADRLVQGTLADFTRAMRALAAGDLEAAKARFNFEPVLVHSRDEVGDMALNFNRLQEEIGRAAEGLEGAREGLSEARSALTETNEQLRCELIERVRAQESLRKAHEELELRVYERTAELTAANAELQTEIVQRKQAQQALAELNAQIAAVSRKAGMAEVANSVLHNVGNVLNSVNVSVSLVSERLRDTPIADLPNTVELLRAHKDSLGTYLTTDVIGKQVPGFLEMLAQHWTTEHRGLVAEVERLKNNIQHIKDIVTRQQSLSGVSDVMEEVHLPKLIEDALTIQNDALERSEVTVCREFESAPWGTCDRVKLTQILVNLIANAEEALAETAHRPRQLTVRTRTNAEGGIEIHVIDNGCGIPPEVQDRLFTYGFTTKQTGHGFGLHASALAANEMGGTLRAHSDGANCGATFIVTLPPPRAMASISIAA